MVMTLPLLSPCPRSQASCISRADDHAARAVRSAAVDIVRRVGLGGFLPQGRIDQAPVGREHADRVGGAGHRPSAPSPGSGSRRSRPPRAAQERQGSCIQSVPRKAFEGRRSAPDLGQRTVAHDPELEARDGLGGMAGQDPARRRDVEDCAGPSRPCRPWGSGAIIVRRHVVDHDAARRSPRSRSTVALAACAPGLARHAGPRGWRAPSRNTGHARSRSAGRRGRSPARSARAARRCWPRWSTTLMVSGRPAATTSRREGALARDARRA